MSGLPRRPAGCLHEPLLVLALAGATLLTVSCGPNRAGTAGPAGGPAPSVTVVAPVTKVTDGDTLHVTYQGHDDRVRLIGVDTPEVDWYGGHAECFGARAGRYARSRLTGASVGLVFDVNLRDRFGRLLAYVYLGTELFNLTLVSQGYAVADPVPPDTRMASTFASAETQARARRAGLWGACPSRGGPAT